MPPNINPLDSWLRSGPGLITGATEVDACETAHAKFMDDGGRLEFEDFCDALRSAGYLPGTQFKNHDTGAYVTRLQLPETQPDHGGVRRSPRGEDARTVRPGVRSIYKTHADPSDPNG